MPVCSIVKILLSSNIFDYTTHGHEISVYDISHIRLEFRINMNSTPCIIENLGRDRQHFLYRPSEDLRHAHDNVDGDV